MITRLIQADDIPKLSKLFGTVYPETELSNESHVAWKYRSANTMVTSSEDEQGWKVNYTLLSRDYGVNGTWVIGSLSVDTAVRPDQRGKGCFVQSAAAAYSFANQNGIEFTLGFPNKNSLPGFVNRLGFQVIGTVPFLIKPLRYISMLKGWLGKRESSSVDDPPFRIEPSAQFRSRNNHAFLPDLSASALNWETLLSHAHTEYPCRTRRTLEYFRWRYTECPTRNYTILVATSADGGPWKSYVVLRTKKVHGFKAGVIVDLGSLPDEESARTLGFLLDVATRKFREAGLDLILAACTDGSRESEQLYLDGFWSVPNMFLPQPLHVILRMHQNSEQEAYLRHFPNWFLTFGDYDVL